VFSFLDQVGFQAYYPNPSQFKGLCTYRVVSELMVRRTFNLKWGAMMHFGLYPPEDGLQYVMLLVKET